MSAPQRLNIIKGDYDQNPDDYLNEAEDVIHEIAQQNGGQVKKSTAKEAVKKRFKSKYWIREKAKGKDLYAGKTDVESTIEDFVDIIFPDIENHVNRNVTLFSNRIRRKMSIIVDDPPNLEKFTLSEAVREAFLTASMIQTAIDNNVAKTGEEPFYHESRDKHFEDMIVEYVERFRENGQITL